MKPSKDAARPSCLAMNPRNREASIAYRIRLLAAFDSLPEDARADLLEAVQSLAMNATAGTDIHRDDARDIMRWVYAAAGWEWPS